MNKPSAPFTPSHRITWQINFDDETDDRRRIEGEWWCCDNTQRRWFRRALTRHGAVEFHFEDQHEATMFWLAN